MRQREKEEYKIEDKNRVDEKVDDQPQPMRFNKIEITEFDNISMFLNIFNNFIGIFCIDTDNEREWSLLSSKNILNKDVKKLKIFTEPSKDVFVKRLRRKINTLTFLDLLSKFDIQMLKNNILLNDNILKDEYMNTCDPSTYSNILKWTKKEKENPTKDNTTDKTLPDAIKTDGDLFSDLNVKIYSIKTEDYNNIKLFLKDDNYSLEISQDVIRTIYTNLKTMIEDYYKKKQELYNEVIVKIFNLNTNLNDSSIIIDDFKDEFTYKAMVLHTYKAREIILQLYIDFFKNVKINILDVLNKESKINKNIDNLVQDNKVGGKKYRKTKNKKYKKNKRNKKFTKKIKKKRSSRKRY